MKKFALLFVVVMLAFSVTVAAQEINFDNWRVRGSGNWSVEKDGDEVYIVQAKPEGGEASFVFLGIELPENYVFQTELACISGNHVDRPTFGLYFEQEPNESLPFHGYRITFRPSQKEYQLARYGPGGGSTVIGSSAARVPWAWNLEEWRTIKVEKTGSKINIYEDDVLIISAEDSTFTGRTVGLYTYSTAAIFRNIVLTPIK